MDGVDSPIHPLENSIKKNEIMKANVKSIALLTAVFATAMAMTGCTDSSSEAVGPDPELVEICLKGTVSGGLSVEATSSPDSRAVINAKHGELDMSFARSDDDPVNQTSSPSFSTISETIPAKLAASADGSATAITFTPKQYYLTGETYNTSLLQGWYPAVSNDPDNTITFANGVVTVPVNGWNDFIWSGKLDGNKNRPFSVIQFEHLFTQIKIEAYAENQGAKDVWGKIKTIKLKKQQQTYKYALHTGGEVITYPPENDYRTYADLELVRKAVSDDSALAAELELGVATVNTTDNSITTNAVECGYAMIVPIASVINSGKKLSLEIEMVNGVKKTLEVAWEGGYDAGKAYTITLKFTATEIGLTATVDDWTNFDWKTDGDGSFDGEIEL